MNCNCCLTPDQIKNMVNSFLYGELNAGNIQQPLLACDGARLGSARVMTCDQTTLKIEEAIKRVQPVIHDARLSGYGTCQSPLTVNTSWLKAFIRNLADTIPIINVGANSGIDGDGTKGHPLSLKIKHDGSLSGDGTDNSLLAVDTSWLSGKIGEYISGNGVNVKPNSGIAGNGSKERPLELNISHGDSLTGSGTDNNKLEVNSDWLSNKFTSLLPRIKPQNFGVNDGGFKAVQNVTDSISTRIYGGTDFTMGTPDYFMLMGDYVIPCYKTVRDKNA